MDEVFDLLSLILADVHAATPDRQMKPYGRGTTVIIKVYVKPDDHALIRECAKSKHRSVSEFLLSAGLAEINRHVPKKGFQEMVESIIDNYMKTHFPARGEGSEGI